MAIGTVIITLYVLFSGVYIIGNEFDFEPYEPEQVNDAEILTEITG